ncbi:hypothetical protein MLD38_025516 [Melastoma candidum]|uniref:Uncharacterized protein n=1 Tax=Melastoma candidum TaxID=119954 RepID=A0ACB9NXD6_9MYRT|nr:hypothetical protein MLD38_025516 [Melastoma candidum]
MIVASAVHLLYGFYIFSSAIAGDLSQFKSAYHSGQCSSATAVSGDKAWPGDKSSPPIVLVHGIFGFGQGKLGGLACFAGTEKKDDRVPVPYLGSLTSIHDRACESTMGRSTARRTGIVGHYPEWDENHPVHFVGHSAGAQVVRVLQQMLADKAFQGYETTENWILSLTSLSAAFIIEYIIFISI